MSMEEPSQRPSLNMRWDGLQHYPVTLTPAWKKIPWHLPQFPSAALFLGRLSPAPDLPSCSAPGNLGPCLGLSEDRLDPATHRRQ